MAPGFSGADIAQLRALSKAPGQSGNRIKSVESTVNALVRTAAWKGTDGDACHSEWTSSLRPMLYSTAATVFSTSTLWFDITRVGPDAVAPAYVVESPAGRVALFLQALSEYVCLPMDKEATTLDMVEAAVNDAVGATQPPLGGMVTSRRDDGGSEPSVANIKVLDGGSLQLASAPLDATGQLTARNLDATEQPGSAVRALLSVPA